MRETISDGVITIHRYRLGDADDLFRAARESVQEVYPWLPWCRPDFTLAEAESWIAEQIECWNEKAHLEFCFRDQSGAFVGGGGINSVSQSDEHSYANLGYWIRTNCSNQGFATRATMLLADFGLTDLQLQRIEIVTAVGNLASQRVAEKAGAVREGILRNRLMLHDKTHDAAVFSVIPDSPEEAD